jgi:carbon-monoxide dehydrogenase iron sulfur subunit
MVDGMVDRMPNEFVIYIDIEKCLGCLSCYLACATEHSLTKNIYTSFRETPVPLPRIRVVPALGYNVPIRCKHCEKPPCVNVCPSEALYKSPEGAVLLREEACIGCKGCILACPYGAVSLDLGRKVIAKCDFCAERLRKGLPPACVEACPTKALKYGRVEDALLELRERKAREFATGLTGTLSTRVILYIPPSRR